ncbi:oligosaccharide flippase family protein [Exiguobacterium sp. s150]|uniref:lipopolysaccharide biosynthesis protein n=1 Tax=Exiguobacterium sp. s150 TaxID=2751221 RepID=UPI001BEB77FB
MEKVINKIIRLRTKLTWSLIGNLLYALSQWVVISLIAKFGSLEDLGLYTFSYAITAPIMLFFSFQLKLLLATDEMNEYQFTQYLGARIVHLSLGYIFIILLSFLISDSLYMTAILLMVGVIKFFEGLSDISMGALQKESKIDIIGKSFAIKAVLISIIFGTVYMSTNNLVMSVFSLCLVSAIRFFYYDLKKLGEIIDTTPRFDFSVLQIAKIAFPLGITSLIISLNTNIPRYFLEHYKSVEDVGIFSALYYIIVVGTMFVTPIVQLAAPKIAYAYHKAETNQFLKMNLLFIGAMTLFSFTIIMVVYVQGEFILEMIYGSAFSQYSKEFLLVTFALFFGFIGSILNISIVAAREVKYQTYISLVVLCVSLVSSYIFVKPYGITGAAYAIIFSRFIHIFLYIILMKKIIVSRKNNI